jgi:hypothetical protein
MYKTATKKMHLFVFSIALVGTPIILITTSVTIPRSSTISSITISY